MSTGGIAADRLASIVSRIEELEKERKVVGNAITDMYAEAKGKGFNVKVLRTLIAERRKEPADAEEQQTTLDIYRKALAEARKPSPLYGEAA